MTEDPSKKRNIKAKGGTSSRVSKRQNGVVVDVITIAYLNRVTKALTQCGGDGRYNYTDTYWQYFF